MTLVHIPDRGCRDNPPDGEWQAFMSAEEFIWTLVRYSHCVACLIDALNGYCDEWKQSKTYAVKYANKYLERDNHLIVRPKVEHPMNPCDYEIWLKCLVEKGEGDEI